MKQRGSQYRRRIPGALTAGIAIALVAVGIAFGLCGRSPLLTVALPDGALPDVAASAASADRYTGFVLGPKASTDSSGRVWIAGFVFRPTRERHMVDATVTAVALQCSYSIEEYALLFRQLESLITFTADAAQGGNLELTTCPTDARPRGNVDLGH